LEREIVCSNWTETESYLHFHVQTCLASSTHELVLS
jgi:hypothetical protein